MIRISSLALLLALALSPAPLPAAEDGLATLLGLLEKQGHNPTSDPARKAAFLEAVARASDPSATVLDAARRERAEARAQGVWYSPGLRISSSNNLAVVVESLPGSAALQAGIAARSILSSVDGLSVESNRLVTLSRQMRSDSPGKVALSLKAPGGQVRTLTLDRQPITEPVVEWHETLPGGYGYLRVNGLHSGAGEWISKLLQQWEHARSPGVMLDLRDAGGADLESVARIAGLFAPSKSLLFRVKKRDGTLIREMLAGEGEKATMPLLALVNGGTHGAAELLAATLEYSARGAMLMGEPTAGDPLVREILPLESGLFLRLATRVIEFADDKKLDGSAPVMPGVKVKDLDLPPQPTTTSLEWESLSGEKAKSPDPEALARAVRVGHDAVLQRAVDVLSGLKALDVRIADRLLPPPPAPATP
jgi:carboxyl-terminal processing protease